MPPPTKQPDGLHQKTVERLNLGACIWKKSSATEHEGHSVV
jgi:hypothetical protein